MIGDLYKPPPDDLWDDQMQAAGFNRDEWTDRPHRKCECEKCRAYYAPKDGVNPSDGTQPKGGN